jgi:hypothetical protein
MDFNIDMSRAKTFLCASTFLSVVTGSAAFGFGLWLYFHSYTIMDFMNVSGDNFEVKIFVDLLQPEAMQLAASMLAAAGAAVTIISFFGCLGACYGCKRVLTTYGFLLAIALLVEIAAVGIAAAHIIPAERSTQYNMEVNFKNHYRGLEKNVGTIFWDYIMINMKCCGVHGHEDFKNFLKFDAKVKPIPETCCILDRSAPTVQPKDKQCTHQPTEGNSYMKHGCHQAMKDHIWATKLMIAGVSVGLSVLELLGIILAFCYAGYMLTPLESNRTESNSREVAFYNNAWRPI